MLCQGRRVVVVSPAEYRRRVVLDGWTRPEDVPALKVATGQAPRSRVDPASGATARVLAVVRVVLRGF